MQWNTENKNIYNSITGVADYDQSRALPEDTRTLWQQVLKSAIPAQNLDPVLDLGCGTGRFTSILREGFNGCLVGIDPSKEMLSIAQTQKIPATTWQLGSAQNIPCDNESFDLVFLSQVFHHLPNAGEAIIEINRVIRPGKFLAIRNSTQDQLQYYEWLRFFPDAKAIELRRLPSQRELIETVTGYGFELNTHQTVHQIFAHSYLEYLEKIRLRGLSSLKMISENAFKKGIEEFENWIAIQEPDHSISEPVDLFVFSKR
jgi:ubiquinone/menaquinone biosynthesis C-methylase UbiE